MSDFDDLPADVKLHILSFLSVYDAAALAAVSKKNRDMFRSIEYWRQRSRLDFARLPGNEKPQNFYKQCHAEMMNEVNHECGVILTHKWLIDNLTPKIDGDNPTLDQAAMLRDRDHLYAVFAVHSRERYFARFNEIRLKYEELGETLNPSDDDVWMLRTVSAPQTSWFEIAAIHQSDHLTAVRDFVSVLVNYRAVQILKIFLQKLPRDIFQQEELMQCSNGILQDALVNREAGMMSLLLDYGVDPNFLGKNKTLNIVDVPLKCVLRAGKAFIEKMDRLEVMVEFARDDALYEYPEDFHQFYVDGIAAFGQCIIALLTHGADPDLLPTPDMKYQATPRAMAAASLVYVQEREDLPEDVKQQMGDVLNLIISAPICAAAPMLKRLKD